MQTVTLHNNAFPEDQEFEIPGLGLVTNHKPKEVEPIQVAMFEAYGLTFPEDGELVIDQNPKEPEPEAKEEDPPKSDPPVGLSSSEGAPADVFGDEENN